jgi:hypothetical protein
MFLASDKWRHSEQPVLAGHHDVEQTRSGVSSSSADAALAASSAWRTTNPWRDEIVRSGLSEARFVVDEQDACRGRIVHRLTPPPVHGSAGVLRGSGRRRE